MSSDAVPRAQNVLKYVCGWGSAPDPAGERSMQSSHRPAGLKGPTSKGRRMEKRRKGRERERRGGGKKGGVPILPLHHW